MYQGFVPGAEGFTYAKRLEALLGTLHALGVASRESTLTRSLFPNSVGRWGLLQSFRYAVVPPRLIGDGTSANIDAPEVGAYHLYLNVTFDGAWETYMRVIYRDLGPLLDTIFSNCDGYLSSSEHSFDQYTRWVRSREVPGGLLYTESSSTVLDQR